MAGNRHPVDPRLYKLLVEQAKDYALFLLDRENSREAGFDLHLVKPVEPRELVRALDERGGASLH
jgi:CheY-like chemotaxis protein